MPASARDQLLLLYSHLEPWGEAAFAVGDALHQRLLELVPGVELATKWGVPFYQFHGNLAYLNWDKPQQQLYLAFYKGNQLPDPHGLLRSDRDVSMVRKVYLPDVATVHHQAFAELIQHAVDLNVRGVKPALKPRRARKSD
jgi:hypothetical protein